MIFSIVFSNSSKEEFKLQYQVYGTDIATRWHRALVEQCNNNNEIAEKDRLYNFPNGVWTEERLVQELNDCIDVLNSQEEVVYHRAFVGMPQEQLNHLHHYFENLRGGVLSPTDFWHRSNLQVRDALERYNVIIHRAENFYHNTTQEKHFPRIVCRFANRKRYDMIDADYEHFTLLRKFGEVYINYCEVGKPLYDVYKDGDDVVGEDNIRPLRYYSSDFTAYFHSRGNESVRRFLDGMDEWWIQNHNYLGALGFVKDDPKNAMGNIPVAMLVNNEMTPTEIIDALCEYSTMERVEID